MRALVAMSGGVDSSVAAALMLEQGYEVVGVTLKQWEGEHGEMPLAGCCTISDAEDARRVAAQLNVPYYVLDYVEEFTEKVVDHFGEMYSAGLTPNPCIECNRRVLECGGSQNQTQKDKACVERQNSTVPMETADEQIIQQDRDARAV